MNDDIEVIKKENSKLKRKVAFLEQSLSQFNSIKAKYDSLIKKIEEKDTKLKSMNEQLQHNLTLLEQLSITDSLTGLRNRRNFDEIFQQELYRSQRQKYQFDFMILDVDNFKEYNDNYGHDRGDEVLEKIGLILTKFARRSGDFAFRYGGEEFSYITISQGKKKFLNLCNKMLNTIQEQQIEHKFAPYGVITVSIGAVVSAKRYTPKEEIFRLADENLYKSKKNGKNQVTLETI